MRHSLNDCTAAHKYEHSIKYPYPTLDSESETESNETELNEVDKDNNMNN